MEQNKDNLISEIGSSCASRRLFKNTQLQVRFELVSLVILKILRFALILLGRRRALLHRAEHSAWNKKWTASETAGGAAVQAYSLQVQQPDSNELIKEHVGMGHLWEEPKPAKTVSYGLKPQEFTGTEKVLGFCDEKKVGCVSKWRATVKLEELWTEECMELDEVEQDIKKKQANNRSRKIRILL